MGLNYAQVSKLEGEVFLAPSGNSCRFKVLGPGGIRAIWSRRDTENDRRELKFWMERKLGVKLDATEHFNPRTEIAAYREYLNSAGKDTTERSETDQGGLGNKRSGDA